MRRGFRLDISFSIPLDVTVMSWAFYESASYNISLWGKYSLLRRYYHSYRSDCFWEFETWHISHTGPALMIDLNRFSSDL